MLRRGWWQIGEHKGDKVLWAARLQRRVEAALKAEGGTGLAAHRPATGRPGEVRWIQFQIVWQGQQSPKARIEGQGSLSRFLWRRGVWVLGAIFAGRQIGASGISDKEGISRQQEPGIFPTHPVARE